MTNCVFSEENVYALKKTNGLCYECNRNQELKVLQLATFVADEEDNFDNEVEEYRRRLEKNYKLCERCERAVKRSLNQVKSRIVGAKKWESLDRMNTLKHDTPVQKREIVARGLIYISVVVALITFYQRMTRVSFNVDQVARFIGVTGAELVYRAVAYFLAVFTLLSHYLVDNPIAEAFQIYVSDAWTTVFAAVTPADPLDHDIEEFVNIVGMVSSVVLIIFYEGRHLRPLLTLTSIWSFNALMHNHEYLKGTVESQWIRVGEALLGFIALVAAVRMVTAPRTGVKCQDNMSESFHRICPELEESDEESELNESTHSSFQRSSVSHLLNSTLKSTVANGSTASLYSHVMPLNQTLHLPPSVIAKQLPFSSVDRFSQSVSFFNGTAPSVRSFHQNGGRSLLATQNPFYRHLNLDRETPTSEVGSYSYRSRNGIISPPKLSRDLASPDSSWVAGGFFTNSPRKATTPNNTDFVPITSRTSSQSSGFESSTAFSREPSVTKEIINPRHSVLSEPITMRPLKPQPIYPNTINPTYSFVKPSPVGSPLMRGSTISLTASRPGSHTSGFDNHSIFGTSNAGYAQLYPFKSNLSFQQLQHTSPHQKNHRSPLPRRSIFNFKKFSKDLPTL